MIMVTLCIMACKALLPVVTDLPCVKLEIPRDKHQM